MRRIDRWYLPTTEHLILASVVVAVVLAGIGINQNKNAIARAMNSDSRVAQFEAGITALFCTGDNRHDAATTQLAGILLPGAAARDAESGTHLASDLRKIIASTPPPSNCGQLICRLLGEVNDETPTINISDPNGPDRKGKCPKGVSNG